MMLLRPPGVYHAQGDTGLLVEALRRERVPAGARCLDLGTGSGAVALAAADLGAEVTAVDVSRLALATAWLNARLHRRTLHLRRGDLTAPVAGARFDLIVSNPPYVPAEAPVAPRRGPARAWDAGPNGRCLLDRIGRQAPRLLAPHGVLLIVQSSLADPAATVAALRRAGLRTSVAARRAQEFGPVMSGRAAWFEQQGLIPPGVREEELVVVRGVRD
ncbi:methyltransferase [Kitasatospora paracochleata]|uniref:Release factor glutamine methyltransferase n=1 Tax=Kitasatospora paracochleata TaxID=58354 RepID=A0ABT1J4F8_9ACTN|nr:HemK2/MTQ2 family protein methyltransferase [Kitasatospora paracochleata]MCP2311636.1 release factor glutamine methyltransferase [Kitasatospora paracochleata]